MKWFNWTYMTILCLSYIVIGLVGSIFYWFGSNIDKWMGIKQMRRCEFVQCKKQRLKKFFTFESYVDFVHMKFLIYFLCLFGVLCLLMLGEYLFYGTQTLSNRFMKYIPEACFFNTINPACKILIWTGKMILLGRNCPHNDNMIVLRWYFENIVHENESYILEGKIFEMFRVQFNLQNPDHKPLSKIKLNDKIGISEYESNNCGICLEPIQLNDFVLDFNSCVHYKNFHEDCISKWMKVDSLCPLCKKNIHKVQINNLI
jgi:hypothetical protein